MSVTHKINVEAAAAKALLANFRDILEGDQEAIELAVESETNLIEAITAGLDRLLFLNDLCETLANRKGNTEARIERLERQSELIKTAILAAMEAAGIKKVETIATVSVREAPQKPIVTNESAIPTYYFRQAKPTLNKQQLLKDLKLGVEVSGAELSNGGTILSIRRG